MSVLGLCVVFFASFVNIGWTIESDAMKYHLPGNIKPLHYDLQFYPQMNGFEYGERIFTGLADITMVAVEDNVTAIVLNCEDPLKIDEAVLCLKEKPEINLGKGVYDETTYKVSFPLRDTLTKNEEFNLVISFTGQHWLKPRGFAYLPYLDGNTTKFLIGTHMQPIGARVVFPCFDEPKFKAFFKISVGIPREYVEMGYRALSNTEEERLEITDNLQIHHFKTTPLPMSTYLIAMIVSAFESTPPRYFDSVYPGSSHMKPKELRTWTRPNVVHEAEIAQSFGQAIIDIYTNDFQIGYGFNKLDQFSMDVPLLAMENWGLITYGESVIGSAEASVVDIAHESSHLWFGNLVTCHDWTDIWLNEGFATYFEVSASEKVNTSELNGPEVRFSYDFVIDSTQARAFVMDSYDYTHPLTIKDDEPSQYWCYFDDVAYDKGGSFLRMVENVLGHESFYKALRHYLMVNKESIAKPEDLYSAFDFVSKESESDLLGKLPSRIFNDWNLLEGYPLVQVRFSEFNPTTVVLTQEIFRIHENSIYKWNRWNIPISYSTNEYSNFNDTRASVWFWKENPHVQFYPGSNIKWIVVNNLQTGYYRVNYPLSNWMRLFEVLSNETTMKEIHELNRAQIIDDAANLARSTAKSYLSYDFFMRLTNYLENETSYHVWMSAFRNFQYLDDMLSKITKLYPTFRAHINRLTRRLYNTLTPLTKPEDSYQDKKLRDIIVRWACRMGNRDCRADIKKIVSEEYNSFSVMNAVSRNTTAICLAVSFDPTFPTARLFDMYLKSDEIDEKMTLISAIGCSRNEKILKALLERTISPNVTLNHSERLKIFRTIYNANPGNINLLLKFFDENIFEIYRRFGERRQVDLLLNKLARKLGSNYELVMLRNLAKKIEKKFPVVLQCKGTIPSMLEIADTNNNWLRKKSQHVAAWLNLEYGKMVPRYTS